MTVKRYVYFIIALPGIMIFFLLLLEGILRFTGKYTIYTEKIGLGFFTYYGMEEPDWYWTHEPNDSFLFDHGEFQFIYKTNEYGLREREVPWNSDATIRIAVFGDSFTEGVGVTEENSYPAVLECRLKGEGFNASVYNAGVSGSDPFYYFTLLRDKILPFEPTHVIFTLNRTEWGDFVFRGGFERFQPDGTTRSRPSPSIETIYKYSHLARSILHVFYGYNSLLITQNTYEILQRQATDAIVACLDSAWIVCQKYDVSFAVVTHPVPDELCDTMRDNPNDIESLTPLLANAEYPFIETKSLLNHELTPLPCSHYSWPIDGHFNEVGYKKLADEVSDKLIHSHPDWLNSWISKSD